VRNRSFQEIDQELLENTKAYLECRSRGAEPAPTLVDAWDQFYRALEPAIKSAFTKWHLPYADRDDCLQDVWVEVIAHLGGFEHDPRRARLSTWVTTMARHKAVDWIRRRSRNSALRIEEVDEVSIPNPIPGPVADYERRWTQTRVRGVLDGLANRVSTSSFRVLYLRWIEGHDIAAIADATGLTPEQVRLRAHRMKRRFRSLFECATPKRSKRNAVGTGSYVKFVKNPFS
jgi:RNA polymerase sigma-70 factor (ECF subfamily)